MCQLVSFLVAYTIWPANILNFPRKNFRNILPRNHFSRMKQKFMTEFAFPFDISLAFSLYFYQTNMAVVELSIHNDAVLVLLQLSCTTFNALVQHCFYASCCKRS